MYFQNSKNTPITETPLSKSLSFLFRLHAQISVKIGCPVNSLTSCHLAISQNLQIRTMNSPTLPNIGCPDCGGQLLRLVSHSIEDSKRVFRKNYVFYQCEEYKSVSSFLITLTDFFY